MNFEPNESVTSNMLPPIELGPCDVIIVAAHDKVSKNGNEMIELQLCVTDSKGVQVIIRDYLVAHVTWKLKNFCDGFNIDYKQGEINKDQIIDKKGRALIITEEYDGKEFPKVKDYLKPTLSELAPKIEEELNDDIPF